MALFGSPMVSSSTMVSSSIVIKVKYEETLLRFRTTINDKKLALDFEKLKNKIHKYFHFDSDVGFTMTYVDEDGDVVNLADDDDLDEAVRQSLKPLRLTVKLGTGIFGGSSKRSKSQEHQTSNSGFTGGFSFSQPSATSFPQSLHRFG